MEFPGQTVVDVFIIMLASTYSIVGVAHIMLLWHMRKNFFIVLRSPLLACVSGFGAIARFIAEIYILALEDHSHGDGINLIVFPALWIAQAALVLTAVRLLVMYYPSKRAKYGRYTNERRLVRALGFSYILMEICGWSAAAALGKQRAASVVASLGPLLASLTIISATFFGWQLKGVHDLSNMGRDIRLVVGFLLASFPIYVVIKLFMRPDSLERKYGTIVFMALSHTPTVWILNIRPAREALLHEPGWASKLPFSRGFRRTSRVAVTVGITKKSSNRGDRASCEDSCRLAGIMACEPFRAAFGDFCHKSLCSESFQFLVDVFDFKKEVLLETAGHDEARSFKGFRAYLAIVNDYIKDGSLSEVNIDSRTKRDILGCTTFNVYSSLGMKEREEIFSAAEKAISKVLMDNLVNKFMMSRQYRAVVDFE